MDSTNIREFLVFAETMNYSRAAKQLFISDNALASHVAKLEKEIGAKLVCKTAGSLALTPAGLVFIQKSSQILEAIDELTSACQHAGDGVSLHLVGQLLSRAMAVLYRACRSYEEATGRIVEITTSQQSCAALSDFLGQPDADAAFWIALRRTQDAPCLCFDDRYPSVLLYSEPLLFAIPSGNPLSEKESLRCADLQGAEIAYTNDPEYLKGARLIASVLEEQGIHVSLSATRGTTVFEYLYGGLPNRITWWNKSAIEVGSLETQPDFRFLAVSDLDITYDTYLVYRTDRPHVSEIVTHLP